MGLPAARITDKTAHGGMIVMGKLTVLINCRPASRITDLHVCPHLTGAIIPPCATNVLIGGKPAARITDKLTCCCGTPDIIVSGEATVLIGTDGSSSDPAIKAMQDAALQAAVVGEVALGGGEAAGEMKAVEPWTEQGVKDELRKTAAGRKALREAPLGVKFVSKDLTAYGMAAGYRPKANALYLPPGVTDAQAANMAAHELTHARQFRIDQEIPWSRAGTDPSSWPKEDQLTLLKYEQEAWEVGYQDWVQRGKPEIPLVEDKNNGAFSFREEVGREKFNEALDQEYKKQYKIK
jgi:uncharacterized Zn-binding protein involved in type VI secretion